jgi:hypothetical protein
MSLVSDSITAFTDSIRGHRCYSHPVFSDWAIARPDAPTTAALFHQIQSFCASTRPGWAFPEALVNHGMTQQGALIQEIVDSEGGHGPELATMAGYVVNRRAGEEIVPDLYDQDAVEARLRDYSDRFLGSLPGYDRDTGLLIQTRQAMTVFDGRKQTDHTSTIRNLGVAIALEMISNGHLIPGEKHCLVDSGVYQVSLEDREMHYLLEHYGEIGAEQQHEENAVAAVKAVLSPETEPVLSGGARRFLDSLARLWDVLDSALLRSGYAAEMQPAVAV